MLIPLRFTKTCRLLMRSSPDANSQTVRRHCLTAGGVLRVCPERHGRARVNRHWSEPLNRYRTSTETPMWRQKCVSGHGYRRPFGALSRGLLCIQGLTPLAIDRRPFGAKYDFPDRLSTWRRVSVFLGLLGTGPRRVLG